jgi:uncharacterized protein (TIRG00374 family)
MKGFNRRTARNLVGIAGFLSLFLLLDPAETWRVLKGCRMDYVVLSLALMGVVMVIRAQRWWMISRGIGMALPFGSLLEITLVSNFFNLFFPGSLGGDAYRAFTAARLSDRKLRSAAGVVIERMTGLVALILVAVAATILSGPLLGAERGILLGSCAAILLGMGLGCWMLFRARALYDRFGGRLPAFVSRRLTPERWDILLSVTEDIASRPRVFIASTLTGIVLQLVVLSTYYTTSLALGDVVPIHFFFVFFPIIELAGMIPITVNGMGIKEGLVVVFLNLASVTPSFSMGLAILNRLLAFVLALFGGLLWLRYRSRPTGPAGPSAPVAAPPP